LVYRRHEGEGVDLFVQVIEEEVHGVEVAVAVEVENQAMLLPSVRMMELS
jgi:hypothetical protein